MWYAIIAWDHPESLAMRKAHRPDHIARVNELLEAGRLKLAGPMPAIDNDDPGEAGFVGSLIIAEFDDLDGAQEWANADPYVAGGVWGEVSVKPFKPVLP